MAYGLASPPARLTVRDVLKLGLGGEAMGRASSNAVPFTVGGEGGTFGGKRFSSLDIEILSQLSQGERRPRRLATSTGVDRKIVEDRLDALLGQGLITKDWRLTEEGFEMTRSSHQRPAGPPPY